MRTLKIWRPIQVIKHLGMHGTCDLYRQRSKRSRNCMSAFEGMIVLDLSASNTILEAYTSFTD